MKAEIFHHHGQRVTVQRELILHIFAEFSGHVAQSDIYERVHAQLPMVNRSTITRTLEALEHMGQIRHVHDETGAVRYHQISDPLHIHLVCRDCGEVGEIADTSVGNSLRHLLQGQFGFESDLTHFPIAGRCAACAPTPVR